MSGSTKVRTLRYQPIAKPTGTATSDAEEDADEDAPRRHPDVEREPVARELDELGEHRVRRRNERRVDEAARAHRVPEGDDREPRRGDQSGALQGVVALAAAK